MNDNITAYEQLMQFLCENGIPYREVSHAPEGRTDVVSRFRGHSLRQAAKSIVIMVKHGNARRYYLAVVPGDCRVNIDAICRYSQGERGFFAPVDRAQMLTGCQMGSVIPISFHLDLTLLVDPQIVQDEEIAFNAARLDRSVFVSARPFFAAARGTILPIAC
jgi:Ala-tRNA(Pro) deacylase